MMQRKVFDSVGEAEVFASERGVRASFAGDCWEVGWDDEVPFDPEKHTVAFERIVSRNGGEGKVDAPAEIVQRHTVAGLSYTFAAEGKDDACTVSLRAVNGPYNTGEMRHFGVSKEQAMLFRFGSIIEVVLRPAPLA